MPQYIFMSSYDNVFDHIVKLSEFLKLTIFNTSKIAFCSYNVRAHKKEFLHIHIGTFNSYTQQEVPVSEKKS